MTEGYSLSDVAAVTGNRNDGWGDGMGAWWIIIFVLFFAFGGGWGGNGGNALTQQEMQAGFNNQAVIGKLDRLGDGVSSLGYDQLGQMNGLQRDMCTGFSAVTAAVNDARYDARSCCCETNRNIDAVRYEGAQNTCAITNAIHAEGEQTRALITNNRMADQQQYINKLELQAALCGVVRYPSATTYTAGYNPFIGSSGCCA